MPFFTCCKTAGNLLPDYFHSEYRLSVDSVTFRLTRANCPECERLAYFVEEKTEDGLYSPPKLVKSTVERAKWQARIWASLPDVDPKGALWVWGSEHVSPWSKRKVFVR